MNGLTVKEASIHATVSEGLIRQWIKEGILPHFRLGGKGKRGSIRIAVEDLERFIANTRVEKKEPEPIKVPARNSFKHLRLI
jgi:excisionase family DNA binding protein